jgi:hypothetical protein
MVILEESGAGLSIWLEAIFFTWGKYVLAFIFIGFVAALFRREPKGDPPEDTPGQQDEGDDT